MSVIAALCVLLALQTQAQPARAPARDAAVEKKGTSAIRGRVISLEGERPLRRARITIRAPELTESKTTSTDSLGAYEFTELPAGRYTINVSRSGYLTLDYGQLRPGEPGKPLQLADAQVLERVDFALPRAASISGRITDETGDPFPGVVVYAMQLQYFRGRRRIVPVTGGGIGGTQRTDDLGQYRVVGLAPGEYFVMATTRETWSADEDQKEIFGYAQTFLPGVASGTEAQRVKVGVGQELAGVDFTMLPMRTASVSGTAFRSDGTPMAGATVMVGYELSGPAFAMMGIGSTAKVAPDGSWMVRNVSPGDYQARVTSADRDRPSESAIALITVQGADVDGVVLAADAGATIAGRITTDDGSPLPARRLRVSTAIVGGERMPTSGSFAPPDNGAAGADGAFTYKSASGPVAVRVSSLPPGWAVKDVIVNGQDYAQTPLDLRSTQRLDGVAVVVTNKFPHLAGRITDARGKPADGTVILFSTDSSKWTETLGVTRSTRPDQSGAFRFDAVRPGTYLLAALEYVQQWQVHDPEFLEEQRRRAVKVTVGDTAGDAVELRLQR